jgi:aryl-alcohol dehydrogenase-like predicted oxidoreductase
MRLSTEPACDDDRALAVLAAALDAGATLLDTADAYAPGPAGRARSIASSAGEAGAPDSDEIGHNERLIARALAAASGPRPTIVAKGGLVRPGGAWQPDGRARHLAAAARASRERLGVAALDVYLLHAIDPRVPLATSVRALARLRDDGVARAIGVANVNLHQLEQALAIAPLDAIEIELSPWRQDALRGGLVAACERRGIRVLAHRPLGGPAGARRLARDPRLVELAADAGATPAELALAWLRASSPVVVPLPGATTVATARSAVRAQTLALDAAMLAALRARFEDDESPRAMSAGAARPGPAGRGDRDVARDPIAREVVLIVGMPGAGKSTLAADYVARGYLRLNRDDRGGSLAELARELRRVLADGADRVVLDNTYGSRASRAAVVAAARAHGAAVRCVVMMTSLEQAQVNAAARVLAEHGRLLEPAELARAGAVGPGAQFRYRRGYEPPRADEGFVAIDEQPFVPRASSGTHRALVVELDDVVWIGRPRAASGVALVPGAAARLAAWRAAGFALAATTWQPEPFDPDIDTRLVELIGAPLPIARCRHGAGPPVCWCRKPLPGLALDLARRHDLALAASYHVGRGPADRGFAARAGMRYVDAAAGWDPPSE